MEDYRLRAASLIWLFRCFGTRFRSGRSHYYQASLDIYPFSRNQMKLSIAFTLATIALASAQDERRATVKERLIEHRKDMFVNTEVSCRRSRVNRGFVVDISDVKYFVSQHHRVP